MQQGQARAACVSASCGQTVSPECNTEDTPTAGKRFPMQRRGSRKKTLSLNPEEREALENLIEEVIMGGVGEGVIDSDASSSDEDDDVQDENSPSSTRTALPGSTAVTGDGASRQDTSVKGVKKFYPGQLKVALKHMHDLPPRFVRKLAKAQQYLDAGGNMYSKPVVGVGRIDEEEETSVHTKDDCKQATSAALSVTDVPERDRDKTKLKENRLKDAKKMIRTLLTDREQYVDETVSAVLVSSKTGSSCSDAVSSASDQKPPSIAQYHPDEAATCQLVSNSAMSVGRNTLSTNDGSCASVVTCTCETHVYQPCMTNSVTEHAHKIPDVNYRIGHSSNISTSGSRPIPAQPFHSPSLGIPQYQLSMPVVHGMKPAPVLNQSPPGTQFWIPEAVVPNNAAGFYGSSPPVVGMTWVPSALNQRVPYAHSIQPSYPSVQGVHTSYTPQYLYSASPPSHGLVGQRYSVAPFSHPASYALTVVQPDHYVRPVSANFYQNTPPPAYCPTQSHSVGDQRHALFTADVPTPIDGTRKHVDHVHKLSALSAAVQSCHQPLNCSIDARSGHTKRVSAGVDTSRDHDTYQTYSSGSHSLDTRATMIPSVRSHVQQSSSDPLSAVSSQRPRLSRSPATVSLSNPSTVKSSSSSSNLALNTSVAAENLRTTRPMVSEVCTLVSSVVDKTTLMSTVDHPDTVLSHVDTKPLEPRPSNVSNSSLSAAPVSEGRSYTCHCTSADCAEILEPCSTTPAMMQETSSRNIAEEQPDFPCTLSSALNDSLTQTVNDTVVPSVDENSAVVSSDCKDVTCSSRTGENSGETVSSVEDGSVMTENGSVEDQSECRLHHLSVSTSSHHQCLPVSCSESSLKATDEVADISSDYDATNATNTDLSSDLVVTLSSRLVSALIDMFGPPADGQLHYGMPIMCHLALLSSIRQHLSYDDCLLDKREDYQKCSMLYCVG